MCGVGAHQLQEKKESEEERRKRKETAQWVKLLTPTRANDALIGNEEQRKQEKKKRREKEGNREWTPYSATLDQSVASNDPHGSCSGRIRNLPAHRGKKMEKKFIFDRIVERLRVYHLLGN